MSPTLSGTRPCTLTTRSTVILTVTLPKPSPGSALTFQTTYAYDNYDSTSGLLFAHVTDPNGSLTRQGYNQFGQLVRTIDAMGNATSYGYTLGLLSSVTDANGNVTGYGYDAARRLASTTFPDGAVELYTYTGDNLLYQKTDRKNLTITYAYDRHKRMSQKTYPNSMSIVYTYQGQKLTQVVDASLTPTETHLYSYDASFRLASETQGTPWDDNLPVQRGRLRIELLGPDRPDGNVLLLPGRQLEPDRLESGIWRVSSTPTRSPDSISGLPFRAVNTGTTATTTRDDCCSSRTFTLQPGIWRPTPMATI